MEEKIKLNSEQLMQREIELFKTKLNLEMAELNIKQLQKAIDENIPMKNAQLDLLKMIGQIDVLKHNIVALSEQLSSGEI
jgi:hypothetical protein